MPVINADVFKLSHAFQAWMAAVQASTDKGSDKGTNAAGVAAAAMFVLVVTRTNDEWASWSEGDNTFVRLAASLHRSLLLQVRVFYVKEAIQNATAAATARVDRQMCKETWAVLSML